MAFAMIHTVDLVLCPRALLSEPGFTGFSDYQDLPYPGFLLKESLSSEWKPTASCSNPGNLLILSILVQTEHVVGGVFNPDLAI